MTRETEFTLLNFDKACVVSHMRTHTHTHHIIKEMFHTECSNLSAFCALHVKYRVQMHGGPRVDTDRVAMISS